MPGDLEDLPAAELDLWREGTTGHELYCDAASCR